MKLLSFSHAGHFRPGVLIDDAVVDMEALVRRGSYPDHIAYSSVKALVATASVAELQQLNAAARQSLAELGTAIDEVTLGPPIPDAQKVFSVGFNYDANIAEARAHKIDVGNGGPVVSTKLPTSLVGHLAPIELPAMAPHAVDWEGELAIVIGKTCRRADPQHALEHVAGYTVINDVTARDLQMASAQWTIGKSFDTSAPCGPTLVTSDEIPDPHALDLTTAVNDEVVQMSNTSRMLHSIPRLIAFISSAVTLVPGDIVATGTPGGIGAARNPQIFLRDGDTVSVSIAGIGTLTNPVRHEHP